MHSPKNEHWQAVKHVLRYLKNVLGQELLLSSKSDLTVKAYCDSDWQSCPITRKSLTGFYILLGNSLIFWRTKKQSYVAMSSAESEYRAMAMTCCEITWLTKLLKDLSVPVEHVQLFCDNQSALHIARNPVFHERTKHIEGECHLVRDKVLRKEVVLSYVFTKEQPADIFTKVVCHDQYVKLLSKLGVLNMFKHS